MNISYIFNSYPQWNETFLQREIDALVSLGFGVEIWALEAKSVAHQIEISQYAALKKYFHPAAYFNDIGAQLAERLRNVDHLHATSAGVPAQVAMATAKALNVSWSFAGHSHDLWGAAPRQLFVEMERASFATACTLQGAEFLETQNPEHASKVLLVPHGLPLDEFPFTPHRQFYPPHRILAVGPLTQPKGFDYLLYALQMLQNRSNFPEVTVLGDGPWHRQLEKLASVLKLTHLHFEGIVTPAKVRAHMQRASLLVAPCIVDDDNDRDGLPNVLIEAAALGLPIVTTPVGGVGNFVTEETGWICPPRDGAALARLIEDVLDQPQEAFRKVHAARRVVEERYDIVQNIKILADAFAHCVN